MAKDPKQTAKDIVDIVKAYNVVSYTNCLTRLRINLKPTAEIYLDKLKATQNVMDVLKPSRTELQIVLGPGFLQMLHKILGN